MIEWRIFQSAEKDFKSKVDYRRYMARCRCALCHEKLKIGDEFDLRPITYATGFTQQGVIVHRKCLDSDLLEKEEWE